MRKVFFALSMFLAVTTNGQVSKILSVTSGKLKTLLTQTELNTITNLTLTGTIDARDFRIMRDSMTALSVLDINNTTITAYSGPEGTYYQTQTDYSADHLPARSFFFKQTLVSANLPSTIISIGDYAFYYCSGLVNLNIPASYETVGYNAFSYCSGIPEIYIPASVTMIGEYAFQDFSGNINVASANLNYSSVEGVLFDKSQKTLLQCPVSKAGHFSIPATVERITYMSFYNCISLASVDIPFSVSSIESLAFGNCQGMTTVSLPQSVSFLGYGAFLGCTGLSSITVQYDPPHDFGGNSDVFGGIDKSICKLYVPYGTAGLYALTSQWSDFTSIIELPEFRLSQNKLLIGPSGGVVNLGLQTGLEWNAISDKSWLTLAPLTGSGNVTFALTAEPNASVGTRKALLKVLSFGKPSQYALIEQQGVPVVLDVTAGSLKSLFTDEELLTIENLILTGTIDARDFRTISYDMPKIKDVDLGGTTVIAYSGDGGTVNGYVDYPENFVPNYAFSRGLSGNPTLRTVDLPSQITTIGYGAFGNCTALASVTMPSTVTYFAMGAFLNCTGLLSIELSSALTEIGEAAFMGCSSLTSMTIPESVRNINRVAFQGCINIASINIPASVYHLGDNVFPNRIDVDEGNPFYSSSEGVLFNRQGTHLLHFPVNRIGRYSTPLSVTFIESNAFSGCSGLSSVNLSLNVDTIGYWAFGDCSGLDTIVIPPSVKYIEVRAFYNCTDLTTVYSQSTSPAVLGSSSGMKVFENVNLPGCTLFIPFGSSGIYAAADQWKDFGNIVEMPELKISENKLSIPASGDTIKVGVSTGLSWNIVSDKPWLKLSPGSGIGSDTITFMAEANPSYIARYATATISAAGIQPLSILIIQNASTSPLNVSAGSLSLILSEEEKKLIKRIVLYGTVDARDFKTMRDEMYLLEDIDLSHASIVEYTGTDGTFNGAFTYKADYIPYHAFFHPVTLTGKLQLKTVILPESTRVVDTYAFTKCFFLNSVSLPESLFSIGFQTFFECVSLDAVALHDSLEYIGSYAFANCRALFTVSPGNQVFSSLDGILYDKEQTRIIQFPTSKTGVFTLPPNVTAIGDGAFTGSSIYGFVFSNSILTSIGHNAFAYSRALIGISLPSTVKSIGSYAFYQCTGFKTIYSNLDIPLDLSSSEGVFDGVDKNLCKLNVPFGSSALYGAADKWKDFVSIVEAAGLKVLSDSVIVPAAGGSNTFEISSNVNWTLTCDKPWATATPVSGNGYNQVITVTAEENSTPGTRTAILTVLDVARNKKYYVQVIQESPIPVILKSVAEYPLLSDANDITGNNGPMGLTYAPFSNGGIYCNGVYIYSGLPESCNAVTPLLNLNINSLIIEVEFMVDSKITQPVIVCGSGRRWLGLMLNSNGTVGIMYNNSTFLYSGLQYSLNQWHKARLAYDGSTVRLFFDNIVALSITTPLDYVPTDTNIGITNMANGSVFKGWLRNLKVMKETEDPGTGTVQTEISSLHIYPNPASDHLVINMKETAGWEGAAVKIFNQKGTLIFESMLTFPVMTINISSTLPKGIYILEVSGSDNNKKIQKKIIFD